MAKFVIWFEVMWNNARNGERLFSKKSEGQ